MTLRRMPEAKSFARPQNFQWDAPSDVMAKWAERPLAAESDDPNTISIYDVIGEDFWTGGGFTAKRMSAALRSIGKNDVTVKINSPGGDMFEGIAIYNLLREHLEEVLNTLPPREVRILQLRYGLLDGQAYTLEEVGRKMGVTRERVRQIEAQALSRLRHPSIRRKLRDYLGE